MRVRIQKWGNSLALRIPRSFAAETALGPGTEVELTIEEGRLVMMSVPAARYTLAALLAGVTPANLHGEVETDASVGLESW